MNKVDNLKEPQNLTVFSELKDRKPVGVLIENVDLVVVRYGEEVSVLYGRCLHRGAMMKDGHIDGDNLICGVHGWDYRVDTGVSEYNNEEVLHKFSAVIKDDAVFLLHGITAFPASRKYGSIAKKDRESEEMKPVQEMRP